MFENYLLIYLGPVLVDTFSVRDFFEVPSNLVYVAVGHLAPVPETNLPPPVTLLGPLLMISIPRVRHL